MPPVLRVLTAILAPALLAGQASVPAAAQDQPFRASVDLVNVGVTVVDRRGNLIVGLGADDFEIREDGVPQAISHFASGDSPTADVPLHLGLMLDVSQSMVRDIEFTRTASIRFLKTLPRAATITIVDFDTEVRVARFGPRDFPRLVERIRNQDVRGLTALYDAIGVYLDGANELTGRKVMLLYTDGGDTGSSLRLNGLLNLLKASDVTVYVIGSIAHLAQSVRLPIQSIMQQIARTTGGEAFFPREARELDRVYARVLSEMQAQYTIGYLSRNEARDGTWRRIEVKLLRKLGDGVSIRSREGYYAILAR